MRSSAPTSRRWSRCSSYHAIPFARATRPFTPIGRCSRPPALTKSWPIPAPGPAASLRQPVSDRRFSHSDGLEATAARGVRTGADLRGWMDTLLHESLACVDGPAVLLAWEGLHEQRWAVLRTLDDEVFAQRPSSTVRAASRAVGTRLLEPGSICAPSARSTGCLDRGAGGRGRCRWRLAPCARPPASRSAASRGSCYAPCGRRVGGDAADAARPTRGARLLAEALGSADGRRRDHSTRRDRPVVVRAALRPGGDEPAIRASRLFRS